MTKHIRIENADTSDHKVRVIIEEKSPSGEWIRGDAIKLNLPTQMTTAMIHSTRRIVIEED